MGKRRRGSPNYYARRDERARREAAARAHARDPARLAEKMLDGLDLDGLADTMTRGLHRREEQDQ